MNAPQGSAAWFAERAGCVSASRLADVMAKIKSGEAASRANYRAELIAQRLTGVCEEGFTTAAMQWGTDNEPIARAMYEIRTGNDVEQVGFIKHPTIEWAGASPDGLIGDYGLIEIKCPNTATHIDYLLGKVPPKKYQPQMIWQMACTGREWCDFVSFDPRMPSHLQLFVVRFSPEEAEIKAAEEEVIKFLGEVEETLAKLNEVLEEA